MFEMTPARVCIIIVLILLLIVLPLLTAQANGAFTL
ncbi:hypothetical protein NT6N_30720 [Oceaniferula spumae]|uniref:Uncharacterized protein n=1 Tax=Oceaniferula spumae TaxID=2979115 RepID=A0AAT9FPH6_9BACT